MPLFRVALALFHSSWAGFIIIVVVVVVVLVAIVVVVNVVVGVVGVVVGVGVALAITTLPRFCYYRSSLSSPLVVVVVSVSVSVLLSSPPLFRVALAPPLEVESAQCFPLSRCLASWRRGRGARAHGTRAATLVTPS